jgi:hypothetical protein
MFTPGVGGTTPWQNIKNTFAGTGTASDVGTIYPGLDPTFNTEGSVQGGTYTDPETGITYDIGST